MVAKDFFAASILTIFLISTAEKSDGERINLSYFTPLWVGLARSRRRKTSGGTRLIFFIN